MKSIEKGNFPIPFSSSRIADARKQGISLINLHKKVGLIDFDNPPAGIEFLGERLPEGVADRLMRSVSPLRAPARKNHDS